MAFEILFSFVQSVWRSNICEPIALRLLFPSPDHDG